MAPSFFHQAKVIFRKNTILNIRSKEYLRDLIFPIISAIFVIVAKTQPSLQPTAALFMPISLAGFFRSFVYAFVDEKASRHKESQKIMGMRGLSYSIGWISFSYAKGLMISFVFLVLTIANDSYETSTLGNTNIIITYLLYMFAGISQVLLYTTFFSTPKLASELITLIQFIASALQYIAAVNSVQQNLMLLNLLSFIPQTSVSFIFAASGLNKQGLDLSNLGKTYSTANGNTMLIFDAIFYFLLYLYFDQTIQNEYGTQKRKLFFISWIWERKQKKSASTKRALSSSSQSLDNIQGLCDVEQGDFIDESSARYQEEFLNPDSLRPTIQVRKLQKKFGDFTAVNDVSITLYEQQILCLLGHNGAGKTTTISLLTGLIKKNKGKIMMNGLDLDEDIDEIRQNIGLCLQKDVLYDNLTVEEHLRFIGQIKGKTDQEIEVESASLIQKCQLSNEVGKISKILSGGNKRKLSLAMSLIGGSSIVFLDEPSSGLDFNARKEIRTILLNLKQERRTVILTTHHLEEAEEVSDRIAIMVKGQLLALGKTDFIKQKFGVGYHLTITKKRSQNDPLSKNTLSKTMLTVQESEIAKQRVLQVIPQAIFNPQAAAGSIVFTLPFANKEQFSDLFKQIEGLGDYQLDLQMNSLEDAFINIGMDEERFLNPEAFEIPQCLSNPPVFDFWNQTFACFQRKIFVTMRSVSVFMSFFLPLVLQITGVLISTFAVTSTSDSSDPNEQISLKMIQLIVFSVFGIIAYIFVTTNFAGVPVMERESKLKYSLNVMGCRGVPYWLGTFIFDFVLISINTIIFFILCYAIGFDAVTDSVGSILATTISFIISLIMLSYMISFAFEKAQTCYKTMFFINYILFYVLPLILTLISPNVQALLVMLSPFVCYGQSFTIIAAYTLPESSTVISANVVGWQQHVFVYPLIMLVQAAIFGALTLVLEKRKERFPVEQTNVDMTGQDYAILEPEVRVEDARVADPRCEDKIKVSRLCKSYKVKGQPDFAAIKNNSFGVQNGEILGLLGPNGAGKSTTFNVLTALLPKTSGSVKLKNTEVESGLMEVFQDVGICPQFDNIYENLSVLEHLRLFGRMKGLKGNDLQDSIEYFIQVMQLSDYRQVLAGRLSGGNKRKLCVTIALIGGPDMQFFDEPSSGVDPIARRFLWNTLNQSLKLRNGAIVLTTHSMEEAESLCSKLGILINGKFMCYGSPQGLKDRYGEGYKIQFKTQQGQKILEEVSKKFPHAKPLMEAEGTDSVGILFPYNSFVLSEVFHYFQNQLTVERAEITDFQISQSTLASLFVYFSQFQHKRPGDM